MSKDERFYYLAFSAFEEGIGPVRFKRILEKFKSAEKGWKAGAGELRGIIPQNVISRFVSFRNVFDIDSYIKRLELKKISFLTLEDPDYPYLLKQISDAPIVLYIKGGFFKNFPISPDSRNSSNWWITDNKIAVVGTRKASGYGRIVTEMLTSELARSGLTIVSGMALGVDTLAHETAIKNGAKTIAVLGCGVDVIYPSQNKELYEKIAGGNGCIVSEMPLGHFASRATFPARNRIISGLSRGVLMTEGAEDSGALITCSYAANQGREVFAVPGPVTSPLSAGTFSLLKKGAKLVMRVEDILDELGLYTKSKSYNRYNDYNGYKNLSPEEHMILKLLQNEDLTADGMIRKLRLPASRVGSLLSMMEIKGYITSYGGEYKLKT